MSEGNQHFDVTMGFSGGRLIQVLKITTILSYHVIMCYLEHLENLCVHYVTGTSLVDQDSINTIIGHNGLHYLGDMVIRCPIDQLCIKNDNWGHLFDHKS